MSTTDTKRPPLAVVILAAGLGTRMKSDVPKVLHEVCGRPMLAYVIDAALSVSPERIVVVTGPDQDGDRRHPARGLRARRAAGAARHRRRRARRPRAAGRLRRRRDGAVRRRAAGGRRVRRRPLPAASSTRAADGHAHDRRARPIRPTTGASCADAASGGASHRRVRGRRDRRARDRRDQRGLLRVPPRRRCARRCRAWAATTPRASSTSPTSSTWRSTTASTVGPTSRATTRRCAWASTRASSSPLVNAAMRRRLLERLMLAGVTVEDPDTTFVDWGVEVGRDTLIRANTHLLGRTTVGAASEVGPGQLSARRLRRRPRPGRQLASVRVRHRLRLQRGSVRLHPPQHGARRRRQGRHLRRDQEQPHRRGQQGAAPELRRRRHRRPRQQHRRRQHHRQLRRLRQARHDHRRPRAHRQRHDASWRR